MTTGIVKWFDPQKGFGFILSPEGGDVFVHYTSIEGDGFRCLRNGQTVEYHEIRTPKGLQGKQIKLLSCDSHRTTGTDESGQIFP
jgi:CspA family cold shock protein